MKEIKLCAKLYFFIWYFSWRGILKTTLTNPSIPARVRNLFVTFFIHSEKRLKKKNKQTNLVTQNLGSES